MVVVVCGNKEQWIFNWVVISLVYDFIYSWVVSLQEKTLSIGDRLLMIEDTSLVGVTYDQVLLLILSSLFSVLHSAVINQSYRNVDIGGRSSARIYSQNTVGKMAIFNLHMQNYLANGQ